MIDYTPPSPFREWLSRLPFPHAWVMNCTYSPEWDHYLRVAITLGMVRPYATFAGRYSYDHTVQIGPHDVWVGNYPYAYGINGYPDATPRDRRPSFATIRLLKQTIEQMEKHDAVYRQATDA